MKSAASVSAVVGLLASVGLAAGGCSLGESGVPPPLDRIFLPTALVTDPTTSLMYVVNSNSDLRYNAGTLVGIDLQKVAEDRRRTDWPICPTSTYVAGPNDPPRGCCRDYFERGVLNCNERGYIDGRATARLGSFGGAAALQTFTRDGETVRRLFVSVRAEPSITVVDATTREGRLSLRCTDDLVNPDNPLCADSWKVLNLGNDESAPELPEEPFALTLDPVLSVLYVGHISKRVETVSEVQGRVSTIDVCTTGRPRLSAISDRVFANPGEGVTALTLSKPGDPSAPLFATGRVNTPGLGGRNAAEVQSLYVQGASARCAPETGKADRPLSVVSSSGFYSSAFFPEGRDVRGLAFSASGDRAYLLHRNTGTTDNPSAIVVVDRSPGISGQSVNRAVDIVEVCAGPTEMHQHDSGRGPRLFVVCFESGQVYVVDPQLAAVSAIINAGRGPTTMTFSQQDPTVAYVAGFTDNDVSVVDLQPGSPTEYRVVQRIGFPRVASR